MIRDLGQLRTFKKASKILKKVSNVIPIMRLSTLVNLINHSITNICICLHNNNKINEAK